jgi:hypothetical protein
VSAVEDRLRRIEKTQTNAWVMRQTTETQGPGEILEHKEETVS